MGLKSFLKSPRQWIREKAAQAVRNNSYGWSWFYIRFLRVNPVEAVKEICEATSAAVAWIVLGIKRLFSRQQSGFKISAKDTVVAIDKMLGNCKGSEFTARLREIVKLMPSAICKRPEFDQELHNIVRSLDGNQIKIVLDEVKSLSYNVEYDKDTVSVVRTFLNGVLAATVRDSEAEQSCDLMCVSGLTTYLLEKNLVKIETLFALVERANTNKLCKVLVYSYETTNIYNSNLIAKVFEQLLQSQESDGRAKVTAVLRVLCGIDGGAACEALQQDQRCTANILYNLACDVNVIVRPNIMQCIDNFLVKELQDEAVNKDHLVGILEEFTRKFLGHIPYSDDLIKVTLKGLLNKMHRNTAVENLARCKPEYALLYANDMCKKREFNYAGYLLDAAAWSADIYKDDKLLQLARDVLMEIVKEDSKVILNLIDSLYPYPFLRLLENEKVVTGIEYESVVVKLMERHRGVIFDKFLDKITHIGLEYYVKVYPKFASMVVNFAFTKNTVAEERQGAVIKYFISQYDKSDFTKTCVDKALEDDNADVNEIGKVLNKLPDACVYKKELCDRLSKRHVDNEEEQSVAPTVAQDGVQMDHSFC